MRAIVLAAALSFLSAAPMMGQYVATQDSSLRGLTKAQVRFRLADDVLNPVVKTQLSEYLNLELRKAGLKIVDDSEELDDKDGVLDLSLGKMDRGRTRDLYLRVSLQQRADLKRTGQSLWMTTWFHETGQHNVVADSVADDVVKDGVNRFLNRWLAMNGR
jgi:hypothetical protein